MISRRMTPLALLIPLATPATQTRAVDTPTLQYYQDHFVVREGRQGWRVPARPVEEKPVLAVSFRKNNNYAVWDERGLTVRRGDRAISTRLPDVPTAPRLFARTEILTTIDLLRQGKRKRAAAGLSGALRLGPDVFFLVRWEEAGGKPWMEALVRVNLDEENLKPKVVGRFEGLSVAFRPIDDRMFRIGDSPAVVTRSASGWGVARIDPKSEAFSYQPIGRQLLTLMPLSRTEALYVETTEAGTTEGGEIDLAQGIRVSRFETRGNARFVDTQEPWIVVSSRSDRATARNGQNGGELPILPGSGVIRAGPFAVVFSPYAKPTSASLYRVSDWSLSATWKLTSEP